METLFNISWAALGLIVFTVGLAIQRRVNPAGKKDLVRTLLLLSAVVFLLLPIISISDDIAYFEHYFSRHSAPDSIFWMTGARREKQFPGSVVLQAFIFLVAAAVVVRCQRAVLGTITPSTSKYFAGRSTTATHLRAPPSFF